MNSLVGSLTADRFRFRMVGVRYSIDGPVRSELRLHSPELTLVQGGVYLWGLSLVNTIRECVSCLNINLHLGSEAQAQMGFISELNKFWKV